MPSHLTNMPSLYHSWLWTWFDFYFESLIWNTDMNISACMNKLSERAGAGPLWQAAQV